MSQVRLFAETDENTARALLGIFEDAFEDDGLPVSAFEDIDNPQTWIVSVYCDVDDRNTIRKRMEALAQSAGHAFKTEVEEIPDIDWVAATLRKLSAVRAGRFIVHGSHETHVPKAHETAILIDAGLAFGTGHHGTTAGCLDMLTRVCKRQSYYNVLDLGTGSGVLAIAAAKTIPAQVMATDIDPVAVETAKFNMKRNGVQSCVECLVSTGFNNRRLGEQGPFDLVIANILAKPLQAMALDLALHTLPGGTVILSGLLPHQKAPLVAAFRQQDLHFEYAHIRDNWLTLVFKKP